MNLISTFQQFIQKHPQVRNGPWLLAVSGGLDSIVLAHICHSQKLPFAIAHCNFNLRGAESLRDKQFVHDFAQQLQVPLFVKDFDTASYIAQTGSSVQIAARELRYKWFTEVAELNRYKFIATAHHSDDNAETVLMHLFRGSGIKGLRGMLPVQGAIIRPLLHTSRQVIDAYAKQYELSWVEDSSNQADKYTRNYIRHHIFPMLQQAIPHSHTGFEHSIGLLGETEMLYNEAIQQHIKKLVEKKGAELHLPVLKLKKLPAAKTILYEIITSYGFTASQLDDAFHLLVAESGRYIASSSHRLIRNRAWLILAPLQTSEAEHILVEKKDAETVFREGVLQIKWLEAADISLKNEDSIALLDATDIHFPLLLRPWRQGDYFYPLGMQKKKKLSRFFIDRKLSKTDKEKIWVIESGKKILWVIGQRVDDRFKVKPATQQALQFHFTATSDALVQL